jgi:predicted phage baseplate assembly protein
VSGLVNTITNFRGELGGTYTICTPIVTTSIASLVSPLAKPPSLQPVNSARLRRDIKQAFARKADIAPQIITVLNPAVESTLYDALSHATVTQSPPLQDIYALRVKATPFGSNAPLKAHTTHTPATPETFEIAYTEWKLDDSGQEKPDVKVLDLDARYDHILPDSWVVIDYADTSRPRLIRKVQSVQPYTRAGFGMSAKVTRLTLDQSWLNLTDNGLKLLRGVTIYAQSEKLMQADEFIDDDISGDSIELDDLYDGLQSGRWVVVSGERTDIPNTNGIRTSELVLLASVTQEVRTVQVAPDTSRPFIQLPGDKTHTVLHFAQPPLAYTYKRSTATVGANVVKATQGETRMEVLGSGDGSKAMQQFTLKQSPLTYVSAPTPAGAGSTLQVYVNDVQWHEVESLDAQGSKAHVFITKTDDTDKTTLTFGNGQQHGARPSTGVENIKALYRTGIGTPGNVDAGQISLLATRPLGVKGVINPKPATGGADRESISQARRNVPLATQALSRIVSVQDYADFARTFAGIGKANALTLPTINRQLVHLTIAGQDNIPIDPTSDLYQNLFLALRTFGNPSEPLRVDVCETKLLVLSLRVRILPDYRLETVSPAIRAALLNAFSVEQRDLGQPVYESEVFSVVQQVPGVAFVDLDILDAVDQPRLLNALDVIHQRR